MPVGVGDGAGVGDGTGVGEGVGEGAGVGDGAGDAGVGDAAGVGLGVGVGVAAGVGEATAVVVAAGSLSSLPHAANTMPKAATTPRQRVAWEGFRKVILFFGESWGNTHHGLAAATPTAHDRP